MEIMAPAGKQLLLGNEAIARGAIEAGIRVVTTYPGTPASEIGDTFSKIARWELKRGRTPSFYFEYSTNEKVAFELTAAASACGLRALTSMKHVGLNVAADALMTYLYLGCKAGHLVVSADDPSCHSSQNEQDNRYYALFASIPMLEPSTPVEAKEMTKEGFELSEELKLPFLLRTTTRLSHLRSVVKLGPIEKGKKLGEFKRGEILVAVPAVARKKHPELLERFRKAEEISNKTHFNWIEGKDGSKLGVITSGIAYTYVRQAIKDLSIDCKLLKLGVSNPLPKGLLGKFLGDCDKILVVEELEPVIEQQVKSLAYELGVKTKIFGKGELLTRLYEYDQTIVTKALANFFGNRVPFAGYESKLELPLRSPQLCPGCPHRATYYALKQVAPKNSIYPTDIGCYTLGLEEPLGLADYLLCMGSSIGTANGFAIATQQPVIAFIGDSTFFHAGLPALIDAAHHRRKFVVVILDNRTTAMTGHQPHPGLEIDGMGKPAKAVDLEALARGCGVEHVQIIDPLDLESAKQSFKRALDWNGISVVIARSPCILLEKRRLNEQGKTMLLYQVDQSKCKKCKLCIEKFGCPAFYWKGNEVWIDESLCNGCGVCTQVCKFDAIKKVNR
jgi:indolepyruvate ferredoxin oxidoreductase alpha subunit